MRKNIDIPDEYIEALQLLCVKEKTNPKKWMEEKIVWYINHYWQEKGRYIKPLIVLKKQVSVGKKKKK